MSTSSKPKITFIPAGPEQAKQLVALDKQIFPEGDIISAEDYENQQCTNFFILTDGHPVGSYGYMLNTGVWSYYEPLPPSVPGTTFILTIGVLPNMRGIGIGQRAMEEIIKSAKAAEQRLILSTCREVTTPQSVVLHRKAGFKTEYVLPNFYPEPNQEDAIVYKLKL